MTKCHTCTKKETCSYVYKYSDVNCHEYIGEEIKPAKTVSIDKDTAIYILEKVVDAIDDTLNDRTKGKYNEAGDLVGTTTKNYLEMFQTLSDKLQNILNEIKGE